MNDNVEILVQVNGKAQEIVLDVPQNLTESQIRDIIASSEEIKQIIAGREVKSIVVVPRRLVNILI